MSQILIQAGFNILCLVIIYFLARRNGRLVERDAQRTRIMSDTAAKFRNFESRMDRWEEGFDKVKSRLDGVDVATISDSELSKLWKDPTEHDVPTNPEALVPFK